MKLCDKDNSGTIDFEEFKLAIMQWSKQSYHKESILI